MCENENKKKKKKNVKESKSNKVSFVLGTKYKT